MQTTNYFVIRACPMECLHELFNFKHCFSFFFTTRVYDRVAYVGTFAYISNHCLITLYYKQHIFKHHRTHKLI